MLKWVHKGITLAQNTDAAVFPFSPRSVPFHPPSTVLTPSYDIIDSPSLFPLPPQADPTEPLVADDVGAALEGLTKKVNLPVGPTCLFNT